MTKPIQAPDETKCFSPRCRSIIKTQVSKKAILFIHGFPATPQCWEFLSAWFFRKGYDVYAPLLPGFGTNPKDLEHTGFDEWYGYALQKELELRNRYETLFVVGHSMGGAITLKIVEESNDLPDGAVTISAPVVYNSRKDGITTNKLYFLSPLLAKLRPAYHTHMTSGRTMENADGHEDWTGYNGLYVRQGMTLVNNLPLIRQQLSTITVPILSIHDESDHTVPVGNLKIIKDEAHGTTWETHLAPGFHHTYHCLPMYHTIQGEIAERIESFFQANTPSSLQKSQGDGILSPEKEHRS